MMTLRLTRGLRNERYGSLHPNLPPQLEKALDTLFAVNSPGNITSVLTRSAAQIHNNNILNAIFSQLNLPECFYWQAVSLFRWPAKASDYNCGLSVTKTSLNRRQYQTTCTCKKLHCCGDCFKPVN